jgi:hypothetical protein
MSLTLMDPLYSTGDDKPPKRPVVPSLYSALSDIDRWLTEHQFDQLKDGDGMLWKLEMQASQLPAKADPRRLDWHIRLAPVAQMSAAALVGASVLQPDDDARLLAMIGTELVPMAMKPTVLTAPSEAEARNLLAAELPRLKAAFKEMKLAEVKRSLIGRWLEERCVFGGRGK